MRYKINFPYKDFNLTISQIFWWANKFPLCSILNSNTTENYPDKYSSFDILIAVAEKKDNFPLSKDVFLNLSEFLTENQDWVFGHFGYDVKNHIENLSSDNEDFIDFPESFYYIPDYLFVIKNKKIELLYIQNVKSKIKNIIHEIKNLKIRISKKESNKIVPKSRVSKDEYLQQVEKIKKHIQRGDIFEVNYCYEYFAENCSINPLETYLQMNNMSSMPFSCFYKLDTKYLICLSPERFLKKEGAKVLSQPMKGTIRRGINQNEDEYQKKMLQESLKEQSENVMIVDLVRNDLSKTAKKGSVEVEELFGVYPFKNIYQMTSTIVANPLDKNHPVEIIKNAFPMGSMTGAPKVKAMQLIEKYEKTKRGIYSGAVGYFTPEMNFDFNVVIRSICYNEKEKYLNFMVGSAITSYCDPEKEYEECKLKAKTFFDWLDIQNRTNGR